MLNIFTFVHALVHKEAFSNLTPINTMLSYLRIRVGGFQFHFEGSNGII